MRPLAVLSTLLVAGSLVATVAAAQQQRPSPPDRPAFDAPVRLAPIERFDGPVTFRGKDGRPQTVRVVVRNWTIPNRQQIVRFPEEGFLIVQLRGGQLTTVISGQRQERREDEYWTVPAGVAMSIETGNDTATIQTTAVR